MEGLHFCVYVCVCGGGGCVQEKTLPFSVSHLSISRPALFADIPDYVSWLKARILSEGWVFSIFVWDHKIYGTVRTYLIAVKDIYKGIHTEIPKASKVEFDASFNCFGRACHEIFGLENVEINLLQKWAFNAPFFKEYIIFFMNFLKIRNEEIVFCVLTL